jgi:hypothetical protein
MPTAATKKKSPVKIKPKVSPPPTTIADLIHDPKNCRKHNPRNIGSIVNSLHSVGAARSIVIDENNVILAGNGMIDAAGEAGIENVRVIEADGNTIIAVRRTGLTDKQKAQLAIADNRTSELAEWDAEQLLATLSEYEIDPASLDFSDDDLAKIQSESPVEVAEDEAPAVGSVPTRCNLGDLWKLGEHRLLCGDSTKAEDVGRVMGGDAIETLVSDPPYGIDFVGDDKPFDPSPFLEFEKVVLFGANCFSDRLPLGTWLVWDKRFKNGTAMLSDAEVAWMKGGHGVYIFAETSQGFVRPESIEHPTQKPVSVMAWCMEKCKAGPIVFDPFLGSGTTMIAAEQLDRRCYGIEISPTYCDVILARWEKFTGKTAQRQ